MLRGARLALQDALTGQIGGAMAQAAKAAALQGKKAAAAAATDAYEDNLDLAVALGWAFVDRVSYEVALPSYVAYALTLFACTPKLYAGIKSTVHPARSILQQTMAPREASSSEGKHWVLL